MGEVGSSSRDVTQVRVHPSVRAIEAWTFSKWMQLVTVILNDGLRKIGMQEFSGCTSLKRIVIPNAVNVLKK